MAKLTVKGQRFSCSTWGHRITHQSSNKTPIEDFS
ncbi:MAG: hypothetical protein ACI90V_006632, partial [Bacillariaceae sp.]